MDVSTAVASRRSVRGFLDTPIDDGLLAGLVEKASRAPSGGNLQPWHIWVLNGDSMARFREFLKTCSLDEAPGYDIYPPKLWEPYRSRRFQVGMALYEKLGIARDDHAGRERQMQKNFDFFGAPAAIFCFIDKKVGPPQWSDCGMYLQTFMLLAKEAGLDTCAQEFWCQLSTSVSEFCEAPEHLMLFCGVAIGHQDPDEPANQLVTPRCELNEFATFL